MNLKYVANTLMIGALLIPVQLGAAQASQTQPDNTKTNKSPGPTADQAKNAASDRVTMQKIRKAIVADKSLSTYGHNVKVICEHSKVTLKGPVHSDEERKNIEAKAIAVAGAENVTNQISVKGDAAARK